MRNLNFELRNLCRDCKEGSFATHSNRLRELDLIANQLHDLGFRKLSKKGLKPKHVVALVEFWKKQSISIGTMKNRMAHLRWWADKIGKFDMLPADNAAFGIENRQYVTNKDKSVELPTDCLEHVSDTHIKMSLQLQAAFGLRREECLKFHPAWADHEDRIVLKASWCKGGRQRCVPITTLEQREVLDKARLLVGFGSMIPSNRSFIQQVKVYEYQTSKVGLHKLHGLRHRYAHTRYLNLTGYLAPADGGPTREAILQSESLSDEQKRAWLDLDNQARLTISNEFGHDREEVTAVYLGR